MSLAPQALRELSAETRTFASVQGALLWYRDVLASRLCVGSAVYRAVGGSGSAQSRNVTRATAAKVTFAIRDLEGLAWLVAWYDSDESDSWLAERLGISRWVFVRLCRKIEREARKRLEAAGVVRE